MTGRKRTGGTGKRRRRGARAPVEARPGATGEVGVEVEGETEPEVEVEVEVEPRAEELEELEDDGSLPDIAVIDADPDTDVDAEPAARRARRAIQVDEEPAEPRNERGIARRDPMAAYIQEIRRIPLLTREEEYELATKFHETGDLEIARRLVTANLRLVVKIAHEYRRAYRNLLDLIQEGNVGLMQAVKKYDPFRGVKLSSYAAWWIRAYILKFILNNWRLVKIGTTQAQRKLFFNLRKEKEKLEQMGFEPEHRLLAERLDVTVDEVAEMERRLDAADMSLDAPISRDDDGGRTRLDAMSGSAEMRPDVRVEGEEFRALLRRKLEEFASDLEGREETLFRERWLTDSPQTLQEIGDRFGISRERARQIEKRLLDRLRDYLERELGTAVDIGAQEQE